MNNFSCQQSPVRENPTQSTFNPLKIIIPVLLSLLLISLMAQYYARQISLPRYCNNPQEALQSLNTLLEDESKIDNSQRRRYMVAAKILFLHPKQNDESTTDYLNRVKFLLMSECSE